MKTILLSLALGALFFAGSLRVVETHAEPAPRIAETAPPPLIPEPPAGVVGMEVVEEELEGAVYSRTGRLKRKPTVRVIRRKDVDYSFSRYAPLGLREVEPPLAPPRID